VKIPTNVRTVRVVDQNALYCEVGKRLRALREEREWSQQYVGNALGVTRSAIANIEGGKQRMLLNTVYDFALLFNVSLTKVLP
jgi:transcriptional regulator with XRE-family HTH domain